jgi:hypothetical protein
LWVASKVVSYESEVKAASQPDAQLNTHPHNSCSPYPLTLNAKKGGKENVY